MICKLRNTILAIAGSILLSQTPALAETSQTQGTIPKDPTYDYLITAKAPKITYKQADAEGQGCYKDLEKLKQYNLVHTPRGGMDTIAQKFWLSTWNECSEPALNFPREAWWATNLGQWAAFHAERPAMHDVAMAWLIAGARAGVKAKSPYPVADACEYINYVRRAGEFACYPRIVAWAKNNSERYATTTRTETHDTTPRTQRETTTQLDANIEQQREQSEQDAYDQDARNEQQRENDQTAQENENQRQQAQEQQDRDDRTAASNEQRQDEENNAAEQQREFQNNQNEEQNYHNEQETQAENDRRAQETQNENDRRQEEANEQAQEQAREEQSREQEQAQEQAQQQEQQQSQSSE